MWMALVCVNFANDFLFLKAFLPMNCLHKKFAFSLALYSLIHPLRSFISLKVYFTPSSLIGTGK